MSGFLAPGEIDTVYLVVGYDYEDTMHDSVWATKEEADARLATLNARQKQEEYEYSVKRKRNALQYAGHFSWVVEIFELEHIYEADHWTSKR